MAGVPRLVLAAAAATVAEALTIWEVGRPQGHVEVLEHVPPPREFFDKYIRGEGQGPDFEDVGKPVLLKGAARKMPAFNLWTDEYLLSKHGKIILDQVEPEKKETRRPLPFEDWTLKKFLKEYTKQEIYSTSRTPKALGKEVYMLPPMNCGGHTRELKETVTWMSSGGTKSVIHNDGNQNFHCMFAGRKEWIMWSPANDIRRPEFGWINVEEEGKDEPEFDGAYGAFVGRIDVDNVDIKRFPAWNKLKWWNMTLSEGDCAFIPDGWYHHVEAPRQRSISTHIWFHSPEKFNQKSCDKLVEQGYDPADYLLTISDCTWRYQQEGKPAQEQDKYTRCKVRNPLKSKKQGDEL